MTKSALKRQRRQEAWQSQKLARRAAEKDKKRQRKLELRQRVDAGEMEKPRNLKKLKRKEATRDKQLHPARVCIDLGFDHLMSDKVALQSSRTERSLWLTEPGRNTQEIKSMAAQLAYCYSANRLSPRPFPLLITSFTGRLREAYKNRQDWQSWKGVEWWEEGIEQLYTGVPEHQEEEQQREAVPEHATSEGCAASLDATGVTPVTSSEAVEPIASTSAAVPPASGAAVTAAAAAPPIALGSLSGQPRSRAPRSTVVYLTGDSPNVLTSLEPGHTYILGGIVDRNRYKRLCLDKAELELGGIRHAQLPIGEALPELKTRKVLTVNQVVEILVKWVEQQEEQQQDRANRAEDDGGDGDGTGTGTAVPLKEGKEAWEAALRSVMPTRKFDPDGKKKRREARKAAGGGGTGGATGGDDDGDSSDDDDDGGADLDSVYVARDEDDEEAADDEDVSMDRTPDAAGAEASSHAVAGPGASAEPSAAPAAATTASTEPPASSSATKV